MSHLTSNLSLFYFVWFDDPTRRKQRRTRKVEQKLRESIIALTTTRWGRVAQLTSKVRLSPLNDRPGAWNNSTEFVRISEGLTNRSRGK